MLYRISINIRVFILLAMAGVVYCGVHGQQPSSQHQATVVFDSLNNRISYLQQQSVRLKQKKDVAYLNLQRELDHTLFVKAYKEYVLDENLEKAKELVELRIEKSEFRRDQASVTFFQTYQDNIYALIKQQKIHYQQLFQKEKNFKKEFAICIAAGTIASYQKAQRMVDLALKYAHENNFTETIQYLETYKSYANALIFDFESVYDLAELTSSAKNFEKAFIPVASSDSLGGLNEAETLLAYCTDYGKLTGSSLNGEYFNKQKMMLTSALSELLDRNGREKELARYTDQSVVAQYDTINPCGVFKWHDQIVVIDEFVPASSMENVKKGEAIIHADRMLATYLQKNKLCQSIHDLKFGYAFIIPFQSNAKNTSFYYNKITEKWQFIACYTVIVNQAYTAEVSKFMPPLFFEDEMDTAQK
jgi:hypothetical protein